MLRRALEGPSVKKVSKYYSSIIFYSVGSIVATYFKYFVKQFLLLGNTERNVFVEELDFMYEHFTFLL